MSANIGPVSSTPVTVLGPDAAPMLPVEQPIVAAALAVEQARGHAMTALALMQWAPRDELAVWQALNALNEAVGRAFEQYSSYSAVRSCAGQG